MSQPVVIEHREGRRAGSLRRNRLRIALGIAAIEGILVLADALPWWVVVAAAVAAVAFYAWVAREHPRADVRQAGWIAAVSQLVVVLVPVAVVIATAVAIVLVVLFAVVILIALLVDRR